MSTLVQIQLGPIICQSTMNWYNSPVLQKYLIRRNKKESHFLLYPLFSWDCSSIGQSTALSRRKLRVRAPSVPTDSIKKFAPQFFFLSFFLSHFSSNKQGNLHYFNQYRLMGEKHMSISTIIGSILFRIPRDTGSVFSIAPDPPNGIEYHIFLGSTYTNGIHFLYDTK